MPAIVNTELIKRTLSDPNRLAAEAIHLVARKSKSGKKGKSKIKGGAIAGIVIAIVVAIIIIAVILFLIKRRKNKKAIAPAH